MDSKIDNRFGMCAILSITSILCVLLITYALFPKFFLILEQKSLNWRYKSKFEKLNKVQNGSVINDIIIVDIDQKTFEQIGRFGKIPREYFAEVINYLSSCGASTIGIHNLFNERDTTNDANDLLTSAVYRAGNVCTGISYSKADPFSFLFKMDHVPQRFYQEKFTFKIPNQGQNIFPVFDRFDGEFYELYNNSRQVGFVNFFPDADGAIRRMPMYIRFNNKMYPSFALSVVLHYFNIQKNQIDFLSTRKINIIGNDARILEIPLEKHGQFLINYKGDFQTFQYVSFYDVYTKHIPAEFFRDRIMLIGSSARQMNDLRLVPFQYNYPGVEIQANIIYNILRQDFINNRTGLVSFFILSGFIIIVVIIALNTSYKISIPVLCVLIFAYIYLAFLSFEKNNLWLECINPIMAMLIAFLSVVVYRFIAYKRKTTHLKQLFSNNISQNSVVSLLKERGNVTLSGELREATAIHLGIVNFSSLSEELSSTILLKTINQYIECVTGVILKMDGYVENHSGDIIVGIWGIPIEQENHTLNACYAAVEILDELKNLNEQFEEEIGMLIDIRIGIHTGTMIVGNIGRNNGFHYKALGSNMEIALRLESANTMYGTKIIISEDIFKEVYDKLWVRELDFIRVRSKEKPVRIYELLGRKSEKINPVRSSSMEYFVEGLELYRQHDWVAAYNMFRKALHLAPEDGPSKEFIRRCKIFMDKPRPDDWDGVFNLRSA